MLKKFRFRRWADLGFHLVYGEFIFIRNTITLSVMGRIPEFIAADINLARNNFSSHSNNARSFFKKKNGMEKKSERINFCLPCIVILANVSSEGNDHR